MKTLFDRPTLTAVLARIDRLRPDAPRAWGKMQPAQMCAHCAVALELAVGDRPSRQKLIGKLLSPLVKKGILGDAPFKKNGPTDATLIVADARDFDAERTRLTSLVRRFGEGGPGAATRNPHLFFGPMTGEQWGVLMYKHLDHHLVQFGA
jgi:hypothetical protein